MRDENSGVRKDCLHSGVKDAAGTLFQFGASPPGSLPNPALSLLEVPGTERGHAIAALHSVLPFCRFRVVPATRPWTALKMNQEVLWLIEQWTDALDPWTVALCRKRHFTAIALEEMRKPATVARGVARPFTQSPVPAQFGRPLF